MSHGVQSASEEVSTLLGSVAATCECCSERFRSECSSMASSAMRRLSPYRSLSMPPLGQQLVVVRYENNSITERKELKT
jgi:hypothetical protein